MNTNSPPPSSTVSPTLKIWSDGAAHSVVVVNPDGGRSLATELR